ncbi:MAG TPA: DEAD/DEAH box helicase family protein [Bacteroidales bacterium]|nr:DEAD/DEAH box helicase family protein [Bacteroidales bacterium]HPF02257.1 DEAD/DEAH box helicase family protein [Bacteroidales bacterium]HPJ58783.1 DEAD/DEAH box helicase family protein [Bacteroidales bacterium]HPR11933.1 DEAD/DEAH box helicase family protein [Bacteroidales bacterium]HRW85368.1 DEAD/DEAH box helicase family protein [Bacteroidales bacterium]
MSYNEADTRAKLIDPAIHKCGWTEDLIRREETAGAVEIIGGRARRRSRGKIDYVLRVRVNKDSQPAAVALIEAKKESLPPGHGLDQAKGYAECRRLNIKFIFSSNGHLFVEFDCFTGLTSVPKPMTEFPAPDVLRDRYEKGMGFKLDSPQARPLIQPYHGGEGTRRYYQDAAIRAVMEKFAQCEVTELPKRALLSMATGCGKTFIAVNLLKRISDAGQLTRALFVCDRDELRTQALKAFQNVFGADAAEVFRKSDGTNNAKNARIHVATYQTLGIENEYLEASFLTSFYPENYFTHVVIDECHRSAWGKWSEVLTRNKKAAQVGLTATPRQLSTNIITKEAQDDADITANNIAYFGEPVYEYTISQAIEDGYLAACEIQKGRVNIDDTGITIDEIMVRNPVDAITGLPVVREQVEEFYQKTEYEDRLLLPDRVLAMSRDLFNYLLETGGPGQKTIIFCARDRHADDIALTINNLYAEWCRINGRNRAEYFAFKCTAASSGNDQLPDFRASTRSHFIATTVDLLTTGVDVPCVRNIVFFKYLKSPISFYQMVGRGTRIDAPTGKLMFRVYDYTDATRLFGEEFVTPPPRIKNPGDVPEPPDDPLPPEPTIQVEGFDVHITDAGRYIVADVDGQAMPVPVEEYKARLTERLVNEVHTLEEFRARWIDPPSRLELINQLITSGYSPGVVRLVDEKEEYDLYDILAELGWGINARTRHERVLAFTYKHEAWLQSLPRDAAGVISAVASQFERGGTEGLENPQIFNTPEVRTAGGLKALKIAGNPRELLSETKQRMFAA